MSGGPSPDRTARVSERYYPRRSSVATGLRCACPRCGRGKLYEGVLKIRDRCPACEFDYSRLNADDGAAFFVIVLFSALVIPLAAWFQAAVEPSAWVHFVIWIPIIVAGSVFLMRIFKAWLVAEQFRHKVDDSDPTR